MAGINQVITPAQAHKLKNICDVAVPLLASDWQGTAAPYTIQVDWPGMTDRDMPEVWLVPAGDTPSDAELAAARLITPSTEEGHMLFSASSKPVTSITARVTGVAVSGEFSAGNMAAVVAQIDKLNRGLTVLWQNPSPTSALSPGTVVLADNINNYREILIEYKYVTNSTILMYDIVLPITAQNFCTYTSVDGKILSRVYFFPDATHAQFNAGNTYNTYGSGSGSTSNSNVVITKIYGRY